jgi:hypothetical protein
VHPHASQGIRGLPRATLALGLIGPVNRCSLNELNGLAVCMGRRLGLRVPYRVRDPNLAQSPSAFRVPRVQLLRVLRAYGCAVQHRVPSARRRVPRVPSGFPGAPDRCPRYTRVPLGSQIGGIWCFNNVILLLYEGFQWVSGRSHPLIHREADRCFPFRT